MEKKKSIKKRIIILSALGLFCGFCIFGHIFVQGTINTGATTAKIRDLAQIMPELFPRKEVIINPDDPLGPIFGYQTEVVITWHWLCGSPGPSIFILLLILSALAAAGLAFLWFAWPRLKKDKKPQAPAEEP